MDPNETLRQIRDLVVALSESADVDSDGFRLAERVSALDTWLSRGGFLPEWWRKNQPVSV